MPGPGKFPKGNALYYGDNLDVLRTFPDECVDLIYLDPPFNSNRSYNVIYESAGGDDASAQIQAFDDTWTWSPLTEAAMDELVLGGYSSKISEAIDAFRRLLGPSDVLAYIVMMTPRLVELRRVLKQTGSIYLHCDPTASHYLKVLLDAVFGADNFRNEIVWHYYNKMHDSRKRLFPRATDTIFFYVKDADAEFTYRQLREQRPEPVKQLKRKKVNGRMVNVKGPDGKVVYNVKTDKTMDNVWRLPMLQPASSEKLGYQTQKPVALLERIIEASSNPDDVVLDPFCGCGTTVDAAQKMGRRWVGIDVTYLAIDLIEKRLRHTYGDDLAYELHGIPRDEGGARALFAENPFDFERWAVSMLDGTPNEKQVGDRGIDGRVHFYANEHERGTALVSVKGGKAINPGMVRDLVGTVQRERAELGVLITLTEPTRGMKEEAGKAGSYEHELTGRSFPRIQLVTIADLLAGKRPKMPEPILPYIKAKARPKDQMVLEV